MLFRKSNSNRDLIVSSLRRDASSFEIKPVESRFGPSAAQLYFDPTTAVTGGLGTAIDVLRKAKDWASVRIESKILKKIERVSPDILFDMEKKLVFTSNVAQEASAFRQWAIKMLETIKAAHDAGDEEEASAGVGLFMQGVLTFITNVGNLHNDFSPFFGRSVYEEFRSNLNSMTVDDRRAVEAFYSRFEVTTQRMSRIFNKEIPSAVRHDAITVELVLAWMNELIECIAHLFESALLVLEN